MHKQILPMSKLLYRDEHITCYNYHMPTTANFVVRQYGVDGKPYIVNVDRSSLFFVLEGGCYVACNEVRHHYVEAGNMVFIPRNSSAYMQPKQAGVSIVCSFVQTENFCSRFSFSQLINFLPADFEPTLTVLPIRERIANFLQTLRACMDDGIDCNHFHELKLQELFILMRCYYSKEELAKLFYPIIGHDMDFKDFVLTHYLEPATITRFAEMANMSVDTFQRRFKEAFGMSAHKWVGLRKSELVYRDVLLSDKPFAAIADEYHMASQAYLTTFCKRHFGRTPQEIRSERRP